ncbi:MAG: tRNA pseudouridine synthase [Planctomycetota bacterium]
MNQDSNLFGLLNLNKLVGMTSREVVNRVQRLVRPLKAGHAGTLDPMASGVLLVCIGDATRLVSRLQEFSKTYTAEFLLGRSSDTDDSTGNICIHPEPAVRPTPEQLVEELQQLTGVIAQVPPTFSAVHVGGRRAYQLARRGESPDLQPRDIVVHSIQMHEYSWPKLRLTIECGSGTYIRSIARDLGRKLGCGAVMSELERTRIGPFQIADSLDLDHLSPNTISESLICPLQIVGHLPRYRCVEQDLVDIRCGRQLMIDQSRLSVSEELSPGAAVVLSVGDPPQLIAIAEVAENHRVQPRTVFLH